MILENGLEQHGDLNNRQAFSAVRLLEKGRGLYGNTAEQINILMTTENHNMKFIHQGISVKYAETIDRSVKRNFTFLRKNKINFHILLLKS